MYPQDCFEHAPRQNRFASGTTIGSTDRSMISVSHSQFRIVAAAADLLPAEARGTFLRRLVVELRGSRDFKDSDIERAVRVA
jgi:hypothetical protein